MWLLSYVISLILFCRWRPKGIMVGHLHEHTAYVTKLAVSPDGKVWLACSFYWLLLAINRLTKTIPVRAQVNINFSPKICWKLPPFFYYFFFKKKKLQTWFVVHSFSYQFSCPLFMRCFGCWSLSFVCDAICLLRNVCAWISSKSIVSFLFQHQKTSQWGYGTVIN